MDELARLCAGVDSELLTRRSVERIRRELPAYRSISVAEHTEAVARQQRNQLAALAAGREVAGQALEEAAALARSRARQGIDIEILLGAYHLGDQVLWQALVEAADTETADCLPRVAELVFASLHALSMALTTAHAQTSRTMQTRRITAAQRLLELLLAGGTQEEAETHARTIGLDPEGEFVGVAWSAHGSPAIPSDLLAALEAGGGLFAVGYGPSEVLILGQGTSPDFVEDVLGAGAVGVAGVGLVRQGIAGAAMSLGDARLAAGAVVAGAHQGTGVARFDHVWPDACVLSETVRLNVLLAPAAETARLHPHLAEAVVAFADGDMQVARAAQSIHLHPNSLSYRLDRWATLTGWNPRNFRDLRRSTLAIATMPAHAGEDTGAATSTRTTQSQALP